MIILHGGVDWRWVCRPRALACLVDAYVACNWFPGCTYAFPGYWLVLFTRTAENTYFVVADRFVALVQIDDEEPGGGGLDAVGGD